MFITAHITILQTLKIFDFSFMATLEVGIMYDQIVKETIIKTKKVDRGVL